MIIELGHFALTLAFAVATVAFIVGYAFWRGDGRVGRGAPPRVDSGGDDDATSL